MESILNNTFVHKWHHERKAAIAWDKFVHKGRFLDRDFGCTIDPNLPSSTHWPDTLPSSILQTPTEHTHEQLTSAHTCQTNLQTALSGELTALFRAFMLAVVLFKNIVHAEGRGSQVNVLQKWYQEVPHRDELYEKVCPLCYSNYGLRFDVTIAIPQPDPTPAKASCNHIICLPYLQLLVASGHSNYDTCPMCRRFISPSESHERCYQDFVSTIFARRNSRDMPDANLQNLAEADVQAIDTYLATLPGSIVDVRANEKCGPDALETWKRCTMPSHASMPIAIDTDLSSLLSPMHHVAQSIP
jgi:hypothetical protein